MDLRQIRYFTCLFEEQNVTRAARRLNVVQPALSTQIRNLEKEFGLRLFERTNRGMTPTAAGRTLYDLCRPVLRDLENIRQQMASQAGRVSGEISAGIISSLTHSVVAETLAEMAARHPEAVVHVTEAYSGTLLDAVIDGSLDFAIVNNLGETPGIIRQRIIVESLVLVTGAGSGRRLDAPVDPAELHDLDLVLPSRRHGLRVPIDRWLIAQGLEITPRLELDVLTPTLRLVEMSDWATIMPGSAVVHGVREGRLRAAPFAGRPLVREIVFAHRAGHPLSPASERFIAILVDQLAEISRQARGLHAEFEFDAGALPDASWHHKK